MIFRTIIFCLCLWNPFVAGSQSTVHPDSVNSWKNEKSYAYIHTLDNDLKSLQKQPDKRSTPNSSSFFQRLLDSKVIQLLFWILAIGAVIFLLFSIFFRRKDFYRIIRKKQVEETIVEEHAYSPAQYHSKMEEALYKGDFTSAVKFNFLLILQKLHEGNHIFLSPEKTNATYLIELSPQLRRDFSMLVLHFNRVTYGTGHVDASAYNIIKPLFTAFEGRI